MNPVKLLSPMANRRKRPQLVVLCLGFLVGCASMAVTDDVLVTNTANALALPKEAFTISNRSDEGVKTSYQVKTKKGATYSCYVTGTVSVLGRTVSDALCAATGSQPSVAAKPSKATPTAPVNTATPSNPNCNALLKAAGRC